MRQTLDGLFGSRRTGTPKKKPRRGRGQGLEGLAGTAARGSNERSALVQVTMGLVVGGADRISPCWHWVGCCHARILGSFSALKPSLSHPAPRRLTRGIARELGHLQAFGGVL